MSTEGRGRVPGMLGERERFRIQERAEFAETKSREIMECQKIGLLCTVEFSWTVCTKWNVHIYFSKFLGNFYLNFSSRKCVYVKGGSVILMHQSLFHIMMDLKSNYCVQKLMELLDFSILLIFFFKCIGPLMLFFEQLKNDY